MQPVTALASCRVLALICLASASVACVVDVNHAERQYSCEEDGICPTGFSCVSGLCESEVDDGGVVADATRNDGATSPDASAALSLQISSSDGDAEEDVATGVVVLGSSDLEMVQAAVGEQIVALRFPTLDIGNGEPVASAYIQFSVDEVNGTMTTLNVRTEATASPAALEGEIANLSGRTPSNREVNWSVAPWDTVGAAGADQATPDLAPLIRERVNDPEWRRGNSMVFLFTGSGERVAVAFDGDPMAAAQLIVELE